MVQLFNLGLGSVLVLITLGVACLVLLTPKLRVLGPKQHYPDGPSPIPLLGNIATLRRLRANIDKELLRLKAEWGSVCMLWYGSSPVLFINSPRVAKELLNEVSFTCVRLGLWQHRH